MKREFLRSFFSLFLLISCFAGCGSTLYWMGDISKPRYKPSYYKTSSQYEEIIEVPDTERIEQEYYMYP